MMACPSCTRRCDWGHVPPRHLRRDQEPQPRGRRTDLGAESARHGLHQSVRVLGSEGPRKKGDAMRCQNERQKIEVAGSGLTKVLRSRKTRERTKEMPRMLMARIWPREEVLPEGGHGSTVTWTT